MTLTLSGHLTAIITARTWLATLGPPSVTDHVCNTRRTPTPEPDQASGQDRCAGAGAASLVYGARRADIHPTATCSRLSKRLWRGRLHLSLVTLLL